MFQENSYVVVDKRGMDIVKDKDIGGVDKERETKSSLDPGLGSAGDKELDSGNSSNKSPQNG